MIVSMPDGGPVAVCDGCAVVFRLQTARGGDLAKLEDGPMPALVLVPSPSEGEKRPEHSPVVAFCGPCAFAFKAGSDAMVGIAKGAIGALMREHAG